jgi:transcriptional regulator with XRE-family HTH domain
MSAQTTTYSAVLGVILSNLRKQYGKEQSDVAEKMGLSQASYSRLESGKATFSVDHLYQAANALGLPEDEIMSRMNATISQLKNNGVNVQANARANSGRGGIKVEDLLLGAGLAALLIGLLSKR